jgi:hypothetical protein
VQWGSVVFQNSVPHTKSPFLCSCSTTPQPGWFTRFGKLLPKCFEGQRASVEQQRRGNCDCLPEPLDLDLSDSDPKNNSRNFFELLQELGEAGYVAVPVWSLVQNKPWSQLKLPCTTRLTWWCPLPFVRCDQESSTIVKGWGCGTILWAER